jgi:hypothetical protein
MGIDPSRKLTDGETPSSAEREQAVQILSLEYQTLRDEVLARTSGRFQFLGLLTAAAAILASGVSGTVSLGEKWFLGCLAVISFLAGLALFWVLGRNILVLSRRISVIERRINALAFSDSELLSWESEHQRRSLWSRLSLGFLPAGPKGRN